MSYADQMRQAFAFGQRLLDEGVQKKSVCMIACHSPYATLIAFYGAISAGVIPMIFPMPKALGSHEALSERIKHWGLRFALPVTLVLESGLNEKFHESIPSDVNVIQVPDSLDASDWPVRDTPAIDSPCGPDDIAFFQTTSSSTGDHKAVVISHGNIIANVRGIKAAVNMSDQERMISWLPLFHDMGLVGAVLFSFCNRYPLYLMTPVQFVKRPALWLKGMSEHRCTIATAPNFGYDYCSRLVSERDTNSLDLHSVKHLFIGAEPIRVSTIKAFVDKFRNAGITENKIRPAYGLAESTIISSISLPANPAKFICVNPEQMGIGQSVGKVQELPFDTKAMDGFNAEAGIAICTAGKPIDGMQADILDESGNAVPTEGIAGEITLTGHSVALGYVGHGDQLVDRFENGRMHTGDMGVMLDGELYIIERIKNIIIRNGENYLVSALEQRIADLLEKSHEQVAIFETDIHDPDSEVVVLVERQDAMDDRQVMQLLANFPLESHPVNRILFSNARAIPRTTSGKKRHFMCRKLYKSDGIPHHQNIIIDTAKIIDAKKSLDIEPEHG